MVGWDSDRFLIARAARCLWYAAAGPVLGIAVWILDLGLPLVVPAGFTLGGAALGWTGSAHAVSRRAEDAREQLRFALVSYLQQVSLLRYGGAGVATAQLLPDGWAIRRVADELAHAERSGLMPWDGLRRFGSITVSGARGEAQFRSRRACSTFAPQSSVKSPSRPNPRGESRVFVQLSASDPHDGRK